MAICPSSSAILAYQLLQAGDLPLPAGEVPPELLGLLAHAVLVPLHAVQLMLGVGQGQGELHHPLPLGGGGFPGLGEHPLQAAGFLLHGLGVVGIGGAFLLQGLQLGVRQKKRLFLRGQAPLLCIALFIVFCQKLLQCHTNIQPLLRFRPRLSGPYYLNTPEGARLSETKDFQPRSSGVSALPLLFQNLLDGIVYLLIHRFLGIAALVDIRNALFAVSLFEPGVLLLGLLQVSHPRLLPAGQNGIHRL